MNTIKTAFCSYGMSGRVFHGPLLEKLPGFEIVKILERHRNESAPYHPNATIVRSFEEIIDDEAIDLVIVNTPDYLHYDMVSRSLMAGKHVVVEKPFTYTEKEALELIDIAKKNNVMLSVFQNRRWDNDFLTAKKVIQEEKLGRLASFESHFDRYRTDIQDSWKECKDNGSGILYNLGSHMIDQALQLFGMPKHIYADLHVLRDDGEVFDSFDLIMYYNDRFKCMVRGSYMVKDLGPRFILHGTKGSFKKSVIDPQEEDLKAGKIPGSENWGADAKENYGRLTLLGKNGDQISHVETVPGNYLAYYENIYNHLSKGEELLVKPEEAAHTIRIIEAARQSHYKKTAIPVSL